MTRIFPLMERCAELAPDSGDASLTELLAALDHSRWEVRYAAAIALGDRRDACAVPHLVQILVSEDAAGIYGQPKLTWDESGPVFPAGTTEAEKAAWSRRWRLKQAAIVSLGEIGVPDAEALRLLRSYSLNQDEDYAVRAAANHALGLLADAASLETLAAAKSDPEFCARTEARKAWDRVSKMVSQARS